jgi:hypothetical protein
VKAAKQPEGEGSNAAWSEGSNAAAWSEGSNAMQQPGVRVQEQRSEQRSAASSAASSIGGEFAGSEGARPAFFQKVTAAVQTVCDLAVVLSILESARRCLQRVCNRQVCCSQSHTRPACWHSQVQKSGAATDLA